MAHMGDHTQISGSITLKSPTPAAPNEMLTECLLQKRFVWFPRHIQCMWSVFSVTNSPLVSFLMLNGTSCTFLCPTRIPDHTECMHFSNKNCLWEQLSIDRKRVLGSFWASRASDFDFWRNSRWNDFHKKMLHVCVAMAQVHPLIKTWNTMLVITKRALSWYVLHILLSWLNAGAKTVLLRKWTKSSLNRVHKNKNFATSTSIFKKNEFVKVHTSRLRWSYRPFGNSSSEVCGKFECWFPGLEIVGLSV